MSAKHHQLATAVDDDVAGPVVTGGRQRRGQCERWVGTGEPERLAQRLRNLHEEDFQLLLGFQIARKLLNASSGDSQQPPPWIGQQLKRAFGQIRPILLRPAVTFLSNEQ